MPPPLVSIIIPCFNDREYVADAIRTALDQSYEKKEIIVIDDGSTDNSVAVIKKFGIAVKCFTMPHRGGSAARNRGLQLAEGDLIQFLDADDLLDPRKLEEQVEVLLATTADVVYSDWLQYEVDRPEHTRTVTVPHKSSDAVILALQIQNIQTNSPIYRKNKLLAIGGFREELPCCQERDLLLRLACSGASFCHLPKLLHVVRERRGSVSSDELRVIAWMRTIVMNAYTNLAERGELTQARKFAFAALMAFQGRVLLQYGERETASAYFQQARQMEPGGGLSGAYGRLGYTLATLFGTVAAEAILLQLEKAEAVFGLSRQN
jgi:glycosyltransferase involved in cell wall biosynthesis